MASSESPTRTPCHANENSPRSRSAKPTTPSCRVSPTPHHAPRLGSARPHDPRPVRRLTNAAVARHVGASPQPVGKWRKRYLDGGIQGLHDELRPGRPRTYDDEWVAQVIHRALQEKPPTATHWSTHGMGKVEGISASTVSRWFRLFGVKPHLIRRGMTVRQRNDTTTQRPFDTRK